MGEKREQQQMNIEWQGLVDRICPIMQDYPLEDAKQIKTAVSHLIVAPVTKEPSVFPPSVTEERKKAFEKVFQFMQKYGLDVDIKRAFGNQHPVFVEEVLPYAAFVSFFSHEWTKDSSIRDFSGYCVKNTHFLLYRYKHNFTEPGATWGFIESSEETAVQTDLNDLVHVGSPESFVLEKEQFLARVVSVSQRYTEQFSTRFTQKEIQRFILMRYYGYKTKEIAQQAGIQNHTMQTLFRNLSQLEGEETLGRVNVNAEGNWVWDRRTAKVLLENREAIHFLSQEEYAFLVSLNDLGDTKDALQQAGLRPSRYTTLVASIKAKYQSHGLRSHQSEDTSYARRISLMLFLATLRVDDPKSERIATALIDAEGDQQKAAEQLGVHSNQITHFLRNKGYYRR